jgi:hypothetical protein
VPLVFPIATEFNSLFPSSVLHTSSSDPQERSIPHSSAHQPATNYAARTSTKRIEMKRRHSSSARDSSPNGTRCRPEFYDPNEVWEVDDGPEPFIDLTDLPPIEPAVLGYRRQFALWTPDHVVLESRMGTSSPSQRLLSAIPGDPLFFVNPVQECD